MTDQQTSCEDSKLNISIKEEPIDPIKEEFKDPIKDECKGPDEDFDLECSDEEFQTKDGKKWEPSPEEIIEMYENLDKDQILEIGWSTPAKRPPTPDATFECKKDEDIKKEIKSEEKSDFDFQDEVGLTNTKAKAIRPAGYDLGPRGSAKKKTVSLDTILSNMARHRKLDMMEDEDEDPLP